MTVASTALPITYTTTAALLTYAYPFRVLEAGDLKVYLDGTLKTLTTHYTVTAVGSPGGGNIVLTSDPGTGKALMITLELAITQGHDYVENDRFPAESHEVALDRLTMIAQMLYQRDRKRPALPPGSPTIDLAFPDPASYAADNLPKYIRLNAAHTALEAVSQGTDVSGVLDDLLASVTRGTLPAAGSAGRLRRVSDDVGGIWIDTGSEWMPIGGKVWRPENFGGADLAARIVNIMAAMPTEGGTIDARFYNGGNVATAITITKPCTLILGRGHFTTSDTAWMRINNPAGGCRIVGGHGRYATVVDLSATQSGIIVESDQPVEVQRVQFDALATKTAGVAISLNGSTAGVSTPAPRIESCTFLAQWEGVHFISSVGGHVTACDFAECRSVGVYIENIDVADAGDHEIVGCTFNSSLGDLGTAIYQQSSGGLRLMHTKILFHSIGYACDIVGSTNDVLIVGCSIENQHRYGIHFTRTAGAAVMAHVLIIGNEIANQLIAGIFVGSGNHMVNYTIDGNTFLVLTATSGISIGGGEDGIIAGNTFYGAGGSVGITVGAGAVRCDVGLNHYRGGTSLSNASATSVVQPYIRSGSVTGNPGSIAANTRGTLVLTITGVVLNDGDTVTVYPPTGLDAGIDFCGSRVTANDQVTVFLRNTTGGAIDDGVLTWAYLWTDAIP